MKTSHKENTANNYAFQEIDRLSSGRKSTSPLKSIATKMGGAFCTKGNKAKDGAEQHLHAPNDSNMIATYDANVSKTGAVQNIDMDVSMNLPTHKFKKKGRSRK